MEQEIEGQKFVSSRTINLEREQLRVDRETVLRNAERNYNARREKEEMKVARGDHKWMLPNLDEELDSRKKKKKHKKEKKKKKDKKKDSDSDDDWVESDKNKVDESKLGRDSFMEFGFIATYSKEDIKPTTKVDKKQEDDHKKAVAASRELNPQMRAESGGKVGAAPHNRPSHGGQSGDGGLGWLIKAFKRAEDQAKEGDQSLAEIAEKRWGSVETFLGMVSKAKAKASHVDRRLQEELSRLEREYQYSMDDEPNRHTKGIKKPKDDRTDIGGFRKARSRSRSTEKRRRPRSRSRSKEKRRRSRSRDKKDARRRSRSRSRNRSRSRSRSGGRKDRRRSRSKDRQNRSRSRERRKRSSSRDQFVKFARPGESFSRTSAYSNREGGGGWKSSGRKEKEQEEIRKKAAEREKQNKQDSDDSSSDSDKDEEDSSMTSQEAPTNQVLTEAEMNTLASKVMKAELMGNDELAAELKLKLENARSARAEMISKGLNPDQGPEVVIKIKGENMKKRKKTKVETHKDGERVRYFGDDDKYDLKQMFEREKMDTAEDHHQMMARLGSKAEKTNDDFDMDDMIVSKAAGKQSEELEDIKRKNKAVSNQLAMEKTLQDCKWCIGSKRSQKHLMVSMGKSVYLALPGTTSMAQGHCLIVPMGHCMAGTEMDEDVWNEVQDYRKSLVKMYQSRGEDCVFFETAMGFKKHPHMVIECIPLPEDLGSMLPMYFQKAIQECETEWTNNKKLVKLKEKNIARNIPRGLPYFHVDFGMDLGFAHVIEEEEDWNKRFGHEVIGGMLDTDPRTMRNPPWEQFDDQKRKVIEFGGMWSEFDWTKSLKSSRNKDTSDSSDSD